uniref:A2M domain-containing protein n=1 Tax=Panagrellus redivivus TaxID=6233 RepID=A0A7E4V695_PANRE
MSSEVYAVLDSLNAIYLFKPTGQATALVTDDADTVEDAVKALLREAPPNVIKGVYILSFSFFHMCRSSVEAVQKAGYTVIELVEMCRYILAGNIYNLPLRQTVGTILFVLHDTRGYTPIAESKVNVLLKKFKNKCWKLIKVCQNPLDALAAYPSVNDVVYPKFTSEAEVAVLEDIFPDSKLHQAAPDKRGFMITYLQNRVKDGNLDGYEVQQYCTFDLLIKYGTDCLTVPLNDTPPFTITKDIDVGNAPNVKIRASAANSDETHLVKSFKFKGAKLRTVSITIIVDNTLMPQVSIKTLSTREIAVVSAVSPQLTPDAAEVPTSRDDKVDKAGLTTTLPEELSQLTLDPSLTTILTFTCDNRVLIQTDETYTGVKEVLAYVRLEAGMAPIVGQQAFDALKTRPESVFYGITRLLATDFDPDHPDPSWRFKTTRNSDGKLLIHGSDDFTMFPIFLFGLVVKSTLKYIEKNSNFEVASAGIRLPLGSSINDDDLNGVSEKIGVKLAIVEYKL